MEELDECTGGGAGGLEGKRRGVEPGRGALKAGVDVIMDDDALQVSREN